MKDRIQLGMGNRAIVHEMSEGHPGALRVLMEILKDGEAIDPQSFMGSLSAILTLDMYRIYGKAIYQLWDGVCKCDTRMLLVLLRAGQMGITPCYDIVNLSKGIGEINLTELDKQVCERLPEFQKPETKTQSRSLNEPVVCDFETYNPDPADTTDPMQTEVYKGGKESIYTNVVVKKEDPMQADDVAGDISYSLDANNTGDDEFEEHY